MKLIDKAISIIKQNPEVVHAIKEQPLWNDGWLAFGDGHFGVNLYLRNIIRVELGYDDLFETDISSQFPIPTSLITGSGEIGEVYLLDILWKTFNNIVLSPSDVKTLEELYSEELSSLDDWDLKEEIEKRKIDFWLEKKASAAKE
ncbi:MAG: hypothetical protein AB8F95_04510 [Bacteroidia bacterium]